MHGPIEIEAFVNGAWGRLQKIDGNGDLGPKSALRVARMALMHWQENYAQYRDTPLRIVSDGVVVK